MAKHPKPSPGRAVERITLTARHGGAAARDPGATRHAEVLAAEAEAQGHASADLKPEPKESGDVGIA